MDKTVRLWHVTRPECLCCFQHSDFVTSIQFHPRDDRFFLAGSLDTKLRLWSIPDKSVAFVATAPDMVTSVAFTPDGRHSIAGCLNGMCNVYETDGLKAVAQIHVRSARGRNAKGSKITGIDAMSVPAGDPHGEVKLLITSNDSRIRLYNFRDRILEAKFRGNENTCSQIRASFSDDGRHVICGSEDRRAYLWPTAPSEKASSADKRAVEVLETQSAMVTAAVMAPAKVKQTLGLSEDPIYDVCNPPPVTLVNQAEAAHKDKEQQHQPARRSSGLASLTRESPTYLARSSHPDGNVIVVADYSGKIKILRQDCAYHKRRYDSWDTHSTISRRLLRRTNSARHSIASSIGKESAHKTPSERIIAWRNSVIGHHREGSRQGTRTRTPSPHRFADRSRLSSPRPGGADSRSGFTTSPPPSAYKSSMDRRTSSSVESARSSVDAPAGADGASRPDEPKPPASAASVIAQGRDKDNPLWLQGDHSYAFYNRIAHDALAAQQRRPPSLLSPNRLSASHRKISTASALSSDYGSSHGEAEEGDVLRCDTCQGTNFRATKGRNGKQKLICVRCARPIS
ncbi:WD40 repeat-like protein [Aspergillus steynii IBT 23096]|uniref:WD40 repeat-like protein n=1 Tax=Aspergillus steynii IBT 23096 TaxID=1392250 RepID=A0A2I2G0A5_9EURO|nr:WD40 repeat-like protein [Aspergillus steynii IBT 23096]PLB46307.1 WD40 repeat-like protein [Aspergillus steynii IBT 23096]